jgi:hypothetical protein
MDVSTLNEAFLIEVGRAVMDLNEWRRRGDDREFSLMTDPNDNNLVECNLMEGTRHEWAIEGKIHNGKTLETVYDVLKAAQEKWNRGKEQADG